MHYRGGLLSSLFLSLSHSSSLFRLPSFPPTVVLAHHVVLSPLDLLSIPATLRRQKRLAAGIRRRITGHVVIIRHCRVMIRECARPLLYAFFLPFLPLPLKGPTEVVDGLNHRRGSRRTPSPLPFAAATTVPRRERIASSRSIVHYEKQKCTARQWRDPWPRRTIDLTIYTLFPALSFALYPTANDGIYVARVRQKSVLRLRRRRRKKKKKRKGAENKEEEKIEMKCWVARPIRRLSMYDERKTKTRDDSEATSYESISVRRRKGGYASDEVYSLPILGLLWATAI